VAVAIATIVILLTVFVPVELSLETIVRSAGSITEGVKSIESITLPAPPPALEKIPLGRRLEAKWRWFAGLGPDARAEVLTPYTQKALQWFVAKAGSVGAMLIQFLLTTIVTAIMFANGERTRDGILLFASRLAGRRGHDAAILAAKTIRGVVLGVVGTALMQTAMGAIGLWVTGVPAAALLTAVMFFLCLAQLGPALVLGPAVAWLYWSGYTGMGTTLLVISVIAATSDNVVRPLLIRRGAPLPLLLIFAGVIGGLIAFGVVGIFIGPVVLSVVYALLSEWVSADPGFRSALQG
jgi:predicted PurR-regulated permease PerM